MSNATILHVLVVEDDADTCANLQDILEPEDWRVETAGTARDALDRRDWSDISVVILDRKLPDGDAEDLLPQIKRLAPHAAVVVVTGYADLNNALDALRQGAADYLLKPINPDALRTSISRIIEQKQMQSALRESQRRLEQERDFAESLIQTARMIVLLRDVEGHILRFNPYFEEITGYKLDELHGADWFDRLLLEEDRERLRAMFRGAVVSGRSNWISAIVTKDGSVRQIHWSGKTLLDKAGNTLGFLACGQDATELQRAQQKVVQSERLAAIGQMMAGLAHESRNALQRSRACLEMLALEVEDQPEALDLVGRIERAQNYLATLYEEVRQYAAPLKLRRKPCDLGLSVREIWADLADLHSPKGIELCEHCGEVDLTCNVDPFAIGQVWRNILENAIHVSPEAAPIVVQCAETTLERRAAVRISFIDQGPGMSADERKQIFEPFFTTKTKGTGLGMAIAQRIVSSHGGAIDVADRGGPGAEIIVVLPRDTE